MVSVTISVFQHLDAMASHRVACRWFAGKLLLCRKASKVVEKVPGKVGPGEGSGSGGNIPSKVSASGVRFLGSFEQGLQQPAPLLVISAELVFFVCALIESKRVQTSLLSALSWKKTFFFIPACGAINRPVNPKKL